MPRPDPPARRSPPQRLPGRSAPGATRLALAALVLVVLSLCAGAFVGLRAAPAPDARGHAVAPPATAPATARPAPSSPGPAVPVPTFDRSARSVDDPGSLWVVVNKRRPLGDYTPPDLVPVPVAHTWEPQLRQEASVAVVALFDAAAAEADLALASTSAYRGYAAQTRVYTGAVNADGQAAADSSIARPGSSEHQTGLAIDVGAASGRCSLDACFADTPEGLWLAGNAWRFGFLLRYPADKVPVTGYEFEPWHFRYIGVALATEMHDEGATTLEEFFALPAAPGYE